MRLLVSTPIAAVCYILTTAIVQANGFHNRLPLSPTATLLSQSNNAPLYTIINGDDREIQESLENKIRENSAAQSALFKQLNTERSILQAKAVTTTAATTTAATTQKQETIVTPEKKDQKRKDRIDRARRSLLAAYSCVVTWMLVKYANMSIVQASGLQGVLACSMFASPAMGAAAFCGSFAGMSAHLSSMVDVSFLGVLCGLVFYGYDAGKKIGVGYGGRLGTIAFLSNVAYLGLKNPTQLGTVVSQTIQSVSPLAFATFLAIGATLKVAQSKVKAIAIDEAKASENEKSLATATSEFISPFVLQNGAKLGLMLILFGRLLTTGTFSFLEYARTSMYMFLSSMVAKKSPGFCMPVAALGLVASLLAPSFAPPIYLGAFIGMTGLQRFTTRNFVQASLFATCLLQLGIFNGFGGKLGFLAFLAVNFGI